MTAGGRTPWQPVGADRPVRVGLVGLGAMGRNHLRLLAARDDVEFAFVADPVADSLAAALASVPGARGAADALALIRHDDALALTVLAPRGAPVLAWVLALTLLNRAPAEPYFAQSLQLWEWGRFIQLHGLTQWLGALWPFAALWVGLRLALRAAPRQVYNRRA